MKGNKGFTLVELAIVLIIVGLIIGGILKGQELIANAQITRTVTEMKNFQAALSTFKEAYAALPGDMDDATDRIPGCDGIAMMCLNGNGDGFINRRPGQTVRLNNRAEEVFFFTHLAKADLITGVTGERAREFGKTNPLAAIGGGYMIGDTRQGPPRGVPASLVVRQGMYISLSGESPTNANNTRSVLTPAQAERIDRKLDDGLPRTGSTLGTNNNNTIRCIRRISGVWSYDTTRTNDTGCILYMRLQ